MTECELCGAPVSEDRFENRYELPYTAKKKFIMHHTCFWKRYIEVILGHEI